MEHIISEVHSKQDDLDTIDSQCLKTVKEMEQVREKLASIADSIFAPFTKRTGVTYHEESNAELSRAVAECRAEFTNLIAKMRSQLSVVSAQLSKCEQDTANCTQTVREAELLKSELTANIDKLQSEESLQKAILEEISNRVEQLRQKLDQIDTDTHRKAVSQAASNRQALSKQVAMAELDIERALRERDQILRRCAVEQIYIPLLRGSLSDSDFQVLMLYTYLHILMIECGCGL